MKKSFPGHFPPTKREMDRLWKSCLFTLDTNILLNLYRYSDATRKDFLGVLEAIKDRLWLPHRAAQEYFENRLAVISQQEKAYDEAVRTIQTLQADLSNARQHPFVSDKLMQKLTQVLEEVVAELTSAKATYAKRTSSDEIQKDIGDLFNGRVGQPYSNEQLENICKEGEDRYAKKIPPGYKDEAKNDETSPAAVNYRKYGDLIVWRQIIDRATETNKGVIFVNDDKKEDWWLIFRGRTLGPRAELVEEFLSKTGQGFYMYQADRFLEYAAQYLKHEVTPASMDEIRDLRKRDLDRHIEMMRRHERAKRLQANELSLRARVIETMERLEASRARMVYLQQQANQIRHGQAVYQENLNRSGGKDQDSLERFLEMQSEVAAIERQIAQAHKETKAIEREYASAQHMLADMQRLTEQRREPDDQVSE